MSTAILEPYTVRFARRSTRGFLLGFSGLRCAAIFAAALALLVGLLVGAGVGLVVSAPLWTALLATAFVPVKGRVLVEWLPTWLQWSLRRVTNQTDYRVRVSPPRPAGTMALPGDGAPLRFYNDPLSHACLIHDPYAATLSAVLRVSHPAYVLLAPESQRGRVSTWGRVLASLAQSGTCARVQVLESTIPDPGTQFTHYYEEHGAGTDDWANAQYRELLAQSSFGSSTHRTTITLVLDMKRAAPAIRAAGRGVKGAARVLAIDMSVLEQGLRDAELRLEGWLVESELATIIRQAYDPSFNLAFSPVNDVEGLGVGAKMTTAGPVALSEHWSYLRHDSGFSSVLWISDWPRVDVAPHFLHALIFAPGIRKSFSLLAKPLGTAEAMKALRKEKTQVVTDTGHKAQVGQVQDLADAQEYSDLLEREQALLSGHADIEFCGFLSVSANAKDDLEAAVALIERSAGQCGCETRVLFGSQSQGFVVAALPLGRGAF